MALVKGGTREEIKNLDNIVSNVKTTTIIVEKKVTKKKKTRVNIYIDEDLFVQLKIIKAKVGGTFSDLVLNAAIEKYGLDNPDNNE